MDIPALCEKAADMLKRCGEITVASVSEDGYPRICVVSPLRTEGCSVVYFATSANSEKVRQFRKNPKAGVCYFNGDNSQTLTGTVQIVEDMRLKRKIWQDWLIRHFSGGPEDPDYCLVKFTANAATLWYGGEFASFSIPAGE